MEVTESIIEISASPQTVWSVLDDLPRYPEWNPIIPRLVGRTTVGEQLEGELVIPGMPTPPLMPTITRIVAGRELRWLSVIPGDQGFSAEHIFILEPTAAGTRVVHREVFDGPAAPHLAEPIKLLVRPAYDQFDSALKVRAEGLAKSDLKIHPSVDHASQNCLAAGTRLRCACDELPVEVELSSAPAHNHLCGCSKCWKPTGALLAQIAVVPSDSVKIVSGTEKLSIVDSQQSIKRHACSKCGVHMVGSVDDKEHHFYGLSFVHPELAVEEGSGRPEFAGFVSSIVEAGASASLMEALRHKLSQLGIPSFDGFSPELMDIIAYHKRKIVETAPIKDQRV